VAHAGALFGGEQVRSGGAEVCDGLGTIGRGGVGDVDDGFDAVERASSPSPVSRSTPRERLIATTSCPWCSRADTVRVPMWPVAPATTMRMGVSSRLAPHR